MGSKGENRDGRIRHTKDAQFMAAKKQIRVNSAREEGEGPDMDPMDIFL